MRLRISCTFSKVGCRHFSRIDCHAKCSQQSYLSFSFYLCASVDKCWKLLNIQHKEQVSVHHIIIHSVTWLFHSFSWPCESTDTSSTKSSVSSCYTADIWTLFKIYTHAYLTQLVSSLIGSWLQSRMFLLLLRIFKFFFHPSRSSSLSVSFLLFQLL